MQEIEFIKKEGESPEAEETEKAEKKDPVSADQISPDMTEDADSAEKRRSSGRKKRNRWMLVVIILAAAVILTGILQYCLSGFSGTDYGGGDPYVAVLHVEGTIRSSSSASTQDSYQHNWLLSRIGELMRDSQNRGLLVYVNSPGGSVYQSDELYLKLKEYKETTGRPFYVYFAETAASGAYYISADADCICANRNTQTGSIGVYIGPVISAEKLLEKLGIQADIIKSGENKASGSGYEDLTEDQRAIYQSMVDEMYGRFVTIVAEGRDLSEERVRELGDGRVYTAAQALENGLIDRICTYDEAVRYMSEEEELQCSFVSIQYSPKETLLDKILGMPLSSEEKSGQESASEAESVMNLIEEYSSPQPLYMMY